MAGVFSLKPSKSTRHAFCEHVGQNEVTYSHLNAGVRLKSSCVLSVNTVSHGSQIVHSTGPHSITCWSDQTIPPVIKIPHASQMESFQQSKYQVVSDQTISSVSSSTGWSDQTIPSVNSSTVWSDQTISSVNCSTGWSDQTIPSVNNSTGWSDQTIPSVNSGTGWSDRQLVGT